MYTYITFEPLILYSILVQETYDIIVLWSKLVRINHSLKIPLQLSYTFFLQSSVILVSEDGGKTFTSLTLPYTPVMSHTVPTACDYDCVICSNTLTAYRELSTQSIFILSRG